MEPEPDEEPLGWEYLAALRDQYDAATEAVERARQEPWWRRDRAIRKARAERDQITLRIANGI